MRGLVVACLLVFLTPGAMAGVPGSEVVAVLLGNSIPYSDLEPTRAEEENAERYTDSDKMDEWRRGQAAVNLRKRVLEVTLATANPDCDLDVTQEETATYVDWWRQTMEQIRRDFRARASEIAQRHEPEVYSTISEIQVENADVADAARDKIELWKVNLCLFQTYGGGRVHKDEGAYGWLGEGETLISSHSYLAGLGYPIVISAGTPLKGYIAHFDALIASGDLTLSNPSYEKGFFGYYRNDKLTFFDTEAEAASIETRYWHYPLVGPE